MGGIITGDPASNNGAIGYVYDNTGNRDQRTSFVTPIPTQTFTGGYNPADELKSTFNFDGNGNQLSDAQSRTYTYNNFSQLTRVQGSGLDVAYVYDGDGLRVKKTNNLTGVSNINATNLVNAGGQSLTLKLVTTGSLPAGVSINAVYLQLTLPAGVTIRVTDFSSYTVDSSVFYSSGVAPASLHATGKYIPAAGGQPATLNLAVPSAAGWPLGEFATLICDLPPGSSFTSANFPVSAVEGVDDNGEPIPGINVAVQ